MKIKRFNEMFDNDDLKSRHEIDWLSGKLDNLGKKVDYNYKNENIKNLLGKLAGRHYPFFIAFEEASNSKSGDLEFDGFKVNSSFDPEDNFHSFVAESDDYMVVLGVKINSINNYDIYVMKQNQKNEEDFDGMEYDNVNYDKLLHIIHDVYLKYIEDCGFQDLTYHDYNRYKEINN